jgi:hypothetical protein
MRFPQYWAEGSSGDFVAWRWSFTSLDEAKVLADEAARRLEARFRAGEQFQRHGQYYPDRPFREEILQEIKTDTGETFAVITRNSYGCEVLNTARVMFVDIDLPEAKGPGLFGKLFGKASAAVSPEADSLAKIESWTKTQPGWGWRVYRTRAGLRLLATHDVVPADSPLTKSIFEELDADPLYQKLCAAQNCFRARLTPKPWRCGVREKPERWPYANSNCAQAFAKWDAKYRTASDNWATCALVRAIGNPAVHPQIDPILKLHDEATRAESNLHLA